MASGVIRNKESRVDCRSACKVTVDAGTVVSFDAIPDQLNAFQGWSGACTGQGGCLLTVSEDLHLAAAFIPQRFTLTLAVGGGGDGRIVSTPPGLDCTSSESVCNATFPARTDVTLTATPELLSRFGGWSGACDGLTCRIAITRDRAVAASFDPQRYALIELGTPAGGRFSEGMALSHNGRFIAGNWAGPTRYPFFWDGVMQDTGVRFESYVSGVSDNGVVAGSFYWNGYFRAFRWQGGVFTELATLGGGMSWANGISGNGNVLGWTTRADGQSRAVSWIGDGIMDLGSLGAAGNGCSYAYGSNAAGIVVGESCAPLYAGGTRAVRWRGPGIIDDLGTLGGTYGRAYAINDSGVIVGASSKASGEPLPMFVVDGKMADVGVIPGMDYGQLTAVNEAGLAVGICWSSSGSARGAVATSSRIVDLNDRVDGAPYAITGAYGIDDAGNIVATGMYQGDARAVILRPK